MTKDESDKQSHTIYYATRADAEKAYNKFVKIMKASDEIMSDRRLNNEDYIFAQHSMDRAKDFMRSQEVELASLKDSIEMPSIELSRTILNKTATHILIDELRRRGVEVKGQSINDILEGTPSERLIKELKRRGLIGTNQYIKREGSRK